MIIRVSTSQRRPVARSGSILAPVLFVASMILVATMPAHAGNVVVNVTSQDHQPEAIGCRLFGSEDGFPTEPSAALEEAPAIVVGQAAQSRFDRVEAGRYAISCFQDLNGDGELNRNFLGIPQEPWAASNDARPAMRAPSFDEAAFSVQPDQTVTIDLVVR